MNSIRKRSFMKESHDLASILSKNNSNTYRENLSIAMKVKYINKPGMGKNNIDDINFVKNNIPTELVHMWSINDFKRTSQFTINVPPYLSCGQIEIKQYQVVDQSYMNNVIENRTSTQRYLD